MATAYDDYMAQIAQSRQDVGQRIAGLPEYETSLREKVYGTEQALPSLRGQVGDKIKALYDADKRNADVYSSQSSPMYIRDPYQRDKLISSQHQAELGEIQDIQGMISQRQDVLGSGIQKGLQIYQSGIDAAKWKHSSLLEELNQAMKIDASRRSAGGGAGSTGLKFTQLAAILQSQAPTGAPTSPDEIRTVSGWDYSHDPAMNEGVGGWFSTELGDIANQAGLMQLLQSDPSLDRQLGAGVYQEKYLPQGLGTASDQRLVTEQQEQALVTDIKARLSTAPANVSGNDLLKEVTELYSNLSTDSLKDIEYHINTGMGRPVLSF